jgi:serine/threonine-protein kinase
VQQALQGKYTVEREIARGGAARVFFARDVQGEPVALKVLHPQLAVSVTADRFLREIAFLQRIDHPRIGRLLDYGESEYLVYYVMQFFEGPTLREHLRRVTTATVEETLRLGDELLDAIRYAHDLGIVHRDVKPDNIVLTAGGAVLLDFGIARAVAQSGTDRLTRSGFAVGTSSYMSPEQVQGAEDLDHRSDIYSVGCVLYECLGGSPPFAAAHDELVLRMQVDARAEDVRSVRPDAGPLADVVMRALEPRREDRWQTAADMRQALLAVHGA